MSMPPLRIKVSKNELYKMPYAQWSKHWDSTCGSRKREVCHWVARATGLTIKIQAYRRIESCPLEQLLGRQSLDVIDHTEQLHIFQVKQYGTRIETKSVLHWSVSFEGK